jgi:uncharacterized RDD family membrane protein YckC
METTKETLTIQTPEYVGFQYILAGLGSRAAAFLLDTAVRALIVISLFAAVMLLSRWLPALDPTGLLAGASKTWIMALGVTAYGVVDLGYFLLFEALWSGQTPGKRNQGLRVIKNNGQPIGWLDSAIRNILRAVDLLAGVYPLGVVVIFLSRTNQRIGDYAAGTVVIAERRRNVPRDRTRLRRNDTLKSVEVESHISRLEPEQYQILRSFLQRRDTMDKASRNDLAGILSRRIMERWGIGSRPNISHESFLEQVVALYEERKRAI